MKNLIFIGLNQIGDTMLGYSVIDTVSHYYPNISVHIYNKGNIVDPVRRILQKHPNVKCAQGISTKIFRPMLYKDTYTLYKKMKVLLEEGDLYISSLLGSTTLFLAFLPFLLLLKATNKNKIHILQLRPIWFTYTGHLIDIHCQIISKKLGVPIVPQTHHPIFNDEKIVKPKSMVVLPGASRLWKSFPASKFAYLINYFAKQGYSIKILGSSSEVDTFQANEIMKLVNKNAANLTGKTTLDEYITEIANSSYVISNDSSGQHITHLCHTPCVVLWGRNPNEVVAKSYAWQNKTMLNIFNHNYKYCKKCTFLNKFKTKKTIMKNHDNCEECIQHTLANFDNDEIIAKIEQHIKSLESIL